MIHRILSFLYVEIYFSGSNHYTSTGIVVRTTKINFHRGFFADLRNWRDSMQEELMVVTFEAEVKTQEFGIALSWRYQVEVSICPTQLLQCSN